MAPNLSTWAQNVSPSPTMAVDAKARALRAEGKNICAFGTGEPDFDTPDFLKAAAREALDAGKTKYAPAPGIPELREALAHDASTRLGMPGTQASQVIVSPGGKFSCYLAILATCSPGDEAIIPAPYWVSYPEMVKLAGATPVILQSDASSSFKITAEQLQAAITPKTRLLIINSPSNPSGMLYSREELQSIMDVAIKAGIWVMSDEIYEHLVYDGLTHISPASLSEEARAHTIVVSGFSKTYAMTGWRLGTLIAPEALAKACAKLAGQTTSNATTFAQWGALAAFKHPEAARHAIDTMCASYVKRRKLLVEGLRSIDGIECMMPQGAFYAFPDISAFGKDSTSFAEGLLEEAQVAVVPGSAFGTDTNIRLSYATNEATIEDGLNRLATYCKGLG